MGDTFLALVIRVAPLGAGLLAGLFLLALVTQAYSRDGTLRVRPMVRLLLIVAMASTIAFPREFFDIGVNSVALLMASILFGLSAPSQGLNVRMLGPYLIFVVPFVLATVLHMVGGGELDSPERFRALGIGILGSFLMANYFNSMADLKLLFSLMLPVLVFGALLSIVQAATGQSYLVGEIYSRSGQEVLIAFGFGSSNVLHAMSMMAGLAIAGYFYLTVRRMKWLFLLAAALMIGGLVISSSQAAWGGAVVMVAVLMILAGGGAKLRAVLMLVAVVGLTVLLMFRFESSGAFSPLSGLVRERSAATVSVRTDNQNDRFYMLGGSLSGRLEYWSEARRLYGTSPVWGVGFSEFRVRSQFGAETHNLYLSWLTETGILGFSGFMLMFWIVFARAARVSRGMTLDDRLALNLLVALLAGYLFVGLFWHIEVNRLFWLTFGLLGGMTGHAVLAAKSVQRPTWPKLTRPEMGSNS